MSQFTLSAFADEIDADFKIQMDVLEKNNINHIEIRGVNGRNISELSLEEAADIKKQLDSRNFKISAIGSPIGKIMITDDFAPHFKLFQHILDIAEILGTKYIRVFSFFIPNGHKPEKYRDEVMFRMNQMVSEAALRNKVLLHENEKDIYGDTADRCLDILNAINSRSLRATFDPANFVQCGVTPYPDAFELLNKYIEYMHIKDALFENGHVVPAGEGDGRVAAILKALAQSGYEGFLSLEPHLAAFTGFQQLEPLSDTGMETSSEGEKKFTIALNALNKILKSIN